MSETKPSQMPHYNLNIHIELLGTGGTHKESNLTEILPSDLENEEIFMSMASCFMREFLRTTKRCLKEETI